jgi:Ca2+-binding RTX toxin-like protein
LETSWNADTVDYSLAPGPIDVDDAIVLDDGHGSQDRLVGGGTLRATPFADRIDQTDKGGITVEALGGDDQLLGGPAEDTLRGGPGSDEIAAAGGSDLVAGGAGPDRLDGGPDGPHSGDSVTYSDAPGGVVLSLAEERAEADGHGSSDLVVGFEHAIGSSHDDRLAGTALANALLGGEGADVLHGAEGDDDLQAGPGDDRIDAGPGNDSLGGSAGNDILDGGEGDDNIAGSEGADTLAGGPGRDRALFYTPPGGIRIDLSIGSVEDDGYGTAERVSGVEDVHGSWHTDRITGNGEVNELRGGDGADVIRGLAGDDGIRGDGGPDTLTGGSGRDTLEGDEGDDALAMRDGEADDGSCGSGSDHVEADEGDLDRVGTDCETVERQAGGEGGDGVDPAGGNHGEGASGGSGSEDQPVRSDQPPGNREVTSGPLAGARLARSRRWVAVRTRAPAVLRILLERRIRTRCGERRCVRYRLIGSMRRRVGGGRAQLALPRRWRRGRGIYRLTVVAIETGERVGFPVRIRFRL